MRNPEIRNKTQRETPPNKTLSYANDFMNQRGRPILFEYYFLWLSDQIRPHGQIAMKLSRYYVEWPILFLANKSEAHVLVRLIP